MNTPEERQADETLARDLGYPTQHPQPTEDEK